jgi:Tfp pilus assembly protein FimT
LRARRPRPAFTLFELVLVMVVITAALAIAAPALRGVARGAKMREAATEFLTTCQWARTNAISTARIHRLVIDPTAGTYRVMVQQADEFVAPGTEWGEINKIPDGYQMTFTKADSILGTAGTPGNYVDFYPTGRTDPARVQITAPDGETATIVCLTPSEAFRILRPGEVIR